jgi:hypothetical protein
MSLINKNRNLVVVRAGDKSVHPAWGLSKQRNWDLAVSYFGENPHLYDFRCDFFHHFQGTKWEGLADLFATSLIDIGNYDYIWLPDDDILVDEATINALFARAKNDQFDLFQPALTINSHFSWDITREDFRCFSRRTNFVEIMAPGFSLRCFRLLTGSFKLTSSGWGLEWLWAREVGSRGFKMGIIDATPVFHFRPVGSAGVGGARSSPMVEMTRLLQSQGLRVTPPAVLDRNFR